MHRNDGWLYIGVAACLCVLVTGCWGLPADTPEAIALVLGDQVRFTAGEDDQLQGVEAGTVVDDLSGLAGCWGVYELECAPDVAPDGPCLIAGQTLQFNPVTGELIRYTYQDIVGIVQVMDVWEGTYEVVDDGHLTFDVTRVLSNLPTVTSVTDITDRYRTLPSYDVYVTLSDDRLKATFVTPADNPRTPAGFLENETFIHQRFDCPD